MRCPVISFRFANVTPRPSPARAARSLICLSLLLCGPLAARDVCLPAWQPVWPPASEDRATGRVFARDSQGFTWVGGSLGLFRLDGQSVTAWYPQPEQPSGLPGPQVEALWIDGQDNVWVGTAGGLARRDARSGLIERISLRSDDGPQPEVYSLHAHGEFLVAGTNQGLAALRLDDLSLVREPRAPQEGRPARVYGMTSVGEHLYAASTNGLLIADRTQAFAIDRQATDQLPSLFRDAFLEVIRGPDDRLYAGTRLGIVVFDPEAPDQARRLDGKSLPGLVDGSVFALAFDHRQRLWVGGDRGLARWTPGSATATACSTAAAGAGSSGIAYLWTGGTDELWVGMGSTDGSLRARLDLPGIERLVIDPRSAPGLEGELWYATELADGRIWAATVKGLYRETSPGSRRFETWRTETFADQPVYALSQDQDGDVWIGGPLGLFVDDGNELRRVKWWANAGPPRPGAPPIFTLLSADDRVWVAGAAGLAEIDAASNEVLVLYSGSKTVLAPEGAHTVVTPNIRPWTVFVHEGGRVYSAGEAGVLSIDPRTRDFVAATQYADQGQAYPGSAAVAVAALGEQVYVGDESGVFVTGEDLTDWQRLSMPYPRRSRASRGIAVEPRRREVWFSTVGGVLAYAPDGASPWRFFDSLSGLHADTFSEGAINVLADGRVLLGGESGLSIIDPREVSAPTVVAPTLLSVSVDEQALPLAAGAKVVLEAGQRRLSASFGAADLWLGKETRLEYELSGYDSRLRRQALALPVRYEGLPPADYSLRVRLASPQRGVSDWISIAVQVRPAWWQTIWARLGGLMLLALVAMSAVRLRVRQLTSQARLVADERDRIACELHDRHLQELIGALMIGRRLRGKVEDPRLREQSAEMVALLERSSESARATIRMLAPPEESHPFAEQIRFHAECASRAFSLPVEVREHGDRWPMSEQQQRHAVRIVNEAVINALKHANGKRVTVTVAWAPGHLLTTVVDDGTGMRVRDGTDSGDDAPGMGLRNMQQLARAIAASLTIEPNPPEGTRVALRLKRPPLWSPTRWQSSPAA